MKLTYEKLALWAIFLMIPFLMFDLQGYKTFAVIAVCCALFDIRDQIAKLK